MSKHLGDFDTGSVIYGKFATFRPSTGAAYTLAGTPSLAVYRDNSTTESTSGVTLNVDFDSVTGLNHYTIDTSTDATFYAAGRFFDVVIAAGTVDGVSVVGSVVGSFTLKKAYAGSIVGSGTYGNSALKTLIDAVDDYVDTEVAAIKAKTDNLPSDPADASDVAAAFSTVNTTLATISGYIDTEVAAIKAKTDNLPASPANEATLTTIASYIDTEVAAIKAKTDNLPSDPADASDIAAAFAALTTDVTDLETAVTDLANSAVQLDATGELAFQAFYAANTASTSIDDVIDAIGTGGGGGDPWTTSLPGTYTAGQAGYILGHNLDAQISGIGGATGPGADTVTITIKVASVAVANAQVWISSDSGGSNVIAGTKLTNSQGEVVFLLDAGTTYYLWMQKDGVEPILGQSFVAVADT